MTGLEEQHLPSEGLLAALFGQWSLEDAVPLESVPLPSWHAGPPSSSALVGSSKSASANLVEPDLANELLLPPDIVDTDTLTDPVEDSLAEVDEQLRRENLGSGRDFQEVVERLAPDLLWERLLRRCLPSLAERWEEWRYLLADALRDAGLSLTPDPHEGVLPLLAERQGLVPATEACDPTDLLRLYQLEARQFALLTREQEMVLGQWCDEGRLARRLLSAMARPNVGARVGESALEAAIRRRFDAGLECARRCADEPTTRAGWLALLMGFACRPLPAERLSMLQKVARPFWQPVPAFCRRDFLQHT